MVFRKILVSTDFEPCGDAALALGAKLAIDWGAHLTALHVVVEPLPTSHPLASSSRKASRDEVLARGREELTKRVPPEIRDRFEPLCVACLSDPRDQIVETAMAIGADLIVLGTHGRTGFERLMLGSTAESVVRNSPVSVLIARQKP